MKQKFSNSKWIAIAGVLILILALTIAVPNALRVILSVPLVLFLPGFAMTLILFPRNSLGVPERFLLAVGMSVAFTALTGLLLNVTPWGLQATTLWIALLLILALESAVIFLARRAWWEDAMRLPPAIHLNFNTRQWVLMALAAFMAIVALRVARMPTPQTGLEGYTLLSAQAADTANAIRLGVRSEEFQKENYQIKYQYNGITHDGPTLELNPGEAWEQIVPVPVGELAGKPFTVLLYRLDRPTQVYRHVDWLPETQ